MEMNIVDHMPSWPDISCLRDRPEFMGIVADRIWQTWWKGRGYTLEYVTGLVAESLAGKSLPFTLVAQDGAHFVGTVSAIISDMEERPLYSPWIAALWVDQDHRQQGVGAALVEKAFQAIMNFGREQAYLCAAREVVDFYRKRGWIEIEENVGPRLLTVMRRMRSSQ